MNDSLNILKRIIFSITSLIVYFPIIGGILGAMILAAGAVQSIVYAFWNMLYLLLSLIPSSPIGSIYFFVGFLDIPTDLVPIIVMLGCFFVLVGSPIFIIGVVELGRGLINKQELVDQGIYNIIRHPQNFGIILISLGIMLLVPLTWGQPYTIRIGDFYSWLLFSLIWLIEAKWEENRKIKELNEEYIKYKEKIPFILPFGKILEDKISHWINPDWSLSRRIILWASVYLCFLIISSALFPLAHTFTFTD
jgi:protein-S-isoprenylcysteine O-methyltransferase Ste14